MEKENYQKPNQEELRHCFYCGRPIKFQNYNSTAHLLTKKSGRKPNFNNLIVTCESCNRNLSDRPFREAEFSFFISDLLTRNINYRSLNIEPILFNSAYRADIIVERKSPQGWQKLIVELKTFTTFTSSRIEEIITQLNSYKDLVKEPVKLVLAFPGILPQKDYATFEKAGVEVWDKNFIAKTFRKEMQADSKNFLSLYFSQGIPDNERPDHEQLIQELKDLPTGRNNWQSYQKHIEKILDYLFSDKLSPPISELSDKNRVNRRDIILRNYQNEGFWKYIRERYYADFIVADAKNYSQKIKKKEVLQIANYLKLHGTGLFALIFCRYGEDESAYYTRRERWAIENKMIIVLNDEDVEKMVLVKDASNSPEEIIKQRIEEFRLGL